LAELEIDGTRAFCWAIVPYLGRFKRLQKLSIWGIGDGCDGLGAAIANNPGLLHLNIGGQFLDEGKDATLLPEIFAFVPLEQTMCLQRLELSWFQIQNWAPILRHLQQLESLRLYGHRQIYGTDSIWMSLSESGVNLRHIDVDYVDGGLLNYLASFSGLKTLRITASYLPHDVVTGEHAFSFFTTILPRHAQSLESITILVHPQDKFCFHTDYSSSLLCCQQLTSLSLSIALISWWDAVYNADISNHLDQVGVVSFQIRHHIPTNLTTPAA
jgi:hypothetical protein